MSELDAEMRPGGLEDYEQTYEDFWKRLVETDGQLDPDKVKRELSDYRRIMHTFACVYCEITGSRLSKLLYDPRVYVSEFQAVAQEWEREAIEEATEEVKAERDRLRAALAPYADPGRWEWNPRLFEWSYDNPGAESLEPEPGPWVSAKKALEGGGE